jgi:DUF1680 family protein
MLLSPQGDGLHASLAKTHNSFEVPCGSYAHFKAARYLLRVTRDSRYGDSMERVMYNTVLGAKSLRADGRAFYYADYSFSGRKIYSNHVFPCCSGTLPQVAADYRINAYFRDPLGIYVNLYLPSKVRWIQDGVQVSLSQTGNYPYEDSISLVLATPAPKEFTLRLRIPEWALGSRIEVNGKRWPGEPICGRFAAISRRWRGGDTVDLQIRRVKRLEPIAPQHPNTVAMLCGPLVLFAIIDQNGPPAISRRQLLGARQTGKRVWETGTSRGVIRMLPYVEIDAEQYSTYLRIT